MKCKLVGFMVLVCAIVLATNGYAGIPRLINYQGILTDSEGCPITGSHNLTFSIYDDSLASTPMWTELHTGVDVDNGLFNVILGGVTAIPDSVFEGPERWMGIQVDTDPEMAPRMQITSVAWAFRAAVADSSADVGWSDISGMPGGFADGVDDVGGGGITLPYVDSVAVTNSAFTIKNENGAGTAIKGENKASGNYGSLGTSSQGVYGEHFNGHWGQLGGSTFGAYARHTSGSYGYLGQTRYGVSGYSDTVGVHGLNMDSGNYGHLGGATYGAYGRNTNGNFGNLGTANNGTYGRNANGNQGTLGGANQGASGTHANGNVGTLGHTDYGAYGENSNGNFGSLGTSGQGVYGEHFDGHYGHLGGATYGAHGSNTNGNVGQLGTANNGTYGRNANGNVGTLGGANQGAYGANASGNYGCLGNDSCGVYGEAVAGGYGGYFVGKVCAEDTIVSTSGGYKFPDGTVQITADSGPGGLTLPFVDSVAVANSAFTVKNEDGGGSAIKGENKVNNHAGYLGHSQYGVYGSSSTTGVRGHNDNGNYGSLGTSGQGVYGEHFDGHFGHLGGATYGAHGRNTNGNFGQLGTANNGTYGRNANDNVGTLGGASQGASGAHANGNYGKLGGIDFGVYGAAPAGGYSGYFAGNVCVEDTINATTLDVADTTRTGYLVIDGGADLAESFDITGPNTLEPGSVVVIDAAGTGTLKISTESYDTRVAGVISGAGGIKTGLTLNQNGLVEGGQNVALSGRIYVRATASNGPIHPGDLLTTSSLAGHAMKATDTKRTHGAVLGKAMSSLEAGEGLVLTLVSLQ